MSEYVIQGETLTNIADAIREKAGITSPLFPENMPSYIRNIQTASSDTSEIPDDIVTEAERVASGMISKMGANSLTFLAMSDMHEYADEDNSSASVLERGRRANRNAGQAAKLISDKVKLDFFANLGDFATGGSATTVAGGVDSIRQAREYIADVVADNESFLTPGNHDSLAYSYSTTGECLSYGVLEGLIGTYRYVDFDSKKVRVICLNTSDNNGSVTAKERISAEQLQWFCEVLDLSAKSDASEWGIVILSHHPLDWNAIKPAANVLAAYLDGTSYSATHESTAVSYDFTGKNAAQVIAQFHGHVHGFKVDYINDFRGTTKVPTAVQRIAIPNASFYRNNEYGENGTTEYDGIEFGEETTYDKSDDSTGKNTAFCLVSIDLDERIIYADCFGAGYDRTISYGEAEIITYSVTNNLSNASTTNGTATVTAGSSFATGITANDGYELESITVTMGGVDITSTAVSGSAISIANVTGDIVITVTTTATDGFDYGDFTNLIPTATEYASDAVYNGCGYKNGVYLSSSAAPYEGTDSATVTTGYIPYVTASVVPATIYVKGAEWAQLSHVRLYFFASDKTILSVYLNGSTTDTTSNNCLEKFYTKEVLGDLYYKLTPIIDSNTSNWIGYTASSKLHDVNYIRFSLKGTGENLIVTVDEQIHK